MALDVAFLIASVSPRQQLQYMTLDSAGNSSPLAQVFSIQSLYFFTTVNRFY